MIDRAGVSRTIKRKYGVSLRPQWMEQCVAHIEAGLQQAGEQGQLHLEVQARLVAEQLMHSEIGDSCYPVLSANAASGQVGGLPGGPGAFLQIQEIMDVGVSKHAMWEAVREKEDFEQRGIRPSYVPAADDADGTGNVHTASSTQYDAGEAGGEGSEREPKIPRGLLKLVLTDGQTRISALELAAVPQLGVELPIGTKVLVTRGRFLEATGVFCLDAGGIQVLGGAPVQYEQLTLKSRLEALLRESRASSNRQ